VPFLRPLFGGASEGVESPEAVGIARPPRACKKQQTGRQYNIKFNSREKVTTLKKKKGSRTNEKENNNIRQL
jgi:hypothetical protein